MCKVCKVRSLNYNAERGKMTASRKGKVCKESVQCVHAKVLAHTHTHAHTRTHARARLWEGGSAVLHTRYSSTTSATGVGRPLRCMHKKNSTRSRRRILTRFNARSNVSQSLSNRFVVLTRLRFALGRAPPAILRTASAKLLPRLSTSRILATPCRYKAWLRRTPLPTLMLGSRNRYRSRP